MTDESRLPVPDPTTLTKEAVNAAVDVSRRELKAAVETLQERIHGMNEAETQKFRHVCERLNIAEQQRVEQKADTRMAVEAAMAAQREAVGKSEEAVKEQIVGLRRDIDGVKDRVTTLEALSQGHAQAREGVSAAAGLVIAGLLLLVAVAAVVVTVIVANA